MKGNSNYQDQNKNQKAMNNEIPSFVWINDFIILSGSTAYDKKEPNDIDVIVKLPKPIFEVIMEHSPDLFETIALKINKMFGKQVHFVPSSGGNSFDGIALYDLALIPKEPNTININEDAFKQFYSEEFRELRSASEKIKKEAELSKKEDKIEFGRFFYPLKTSLPAVMLLKGKGLEPALDWVVDNKPIIVNKKYDGNRLIVMVDKNKNLVEIYSEDGRKLPENKLPETKKQLLELNADSFILDCECERWLNGKHLNREDVAGFLHNKTETDDSGIVLNIFDILYYNGKDIHKLPYISRLHYLFNIGIKESTIKIPKPENRLNLAPAYVVNTKEEASRVIMRCASAPASEGAMLKKSTSPYSLKGEDNTWLKVKKYESLKVKVLKVNSTKVPSVVNFVIGIRFKKENIDPSKIVELNGNKYMIIGKTFNVTRDFAKVGDIISVLFHTVNYYKTKKGEYLRIYEPIVEEKHPEEAEPDFFDEVVNKGKISNLLVEKFIEDLRTYNPKDVSDKVLIDDYRWLLVFLNNNIKKYNKELIKKKLGEVIDELFERGIATLHPDRYNDNMREIVIDIIKEKLSGIREIKYPDVSEVIRKNILLSRTKIPDKFLKLKDDNKIVIVKVLEERNVSN